jgi:hypothetical protein
MFTQQKIQSVFLSFSGFFIIRFDLHAFGNGHGTRGDQSIRVDLVNDTQHTGGEWFKSVFLAQGRDVNIHLPSGVQNRLAF